MNNLLHIKSRREFREWLSKKHDKEKECFVVLKRGRPIDNNVFYYLDAVEEALCFGWIDSKLVRVDDTLWQRFCPRTNKSHWTELNKERVRRLEKIGLMTNAGRKILPDMSFVADPKIKELILASGIHDEFSKMPLLYVHIRIDNLTFAYKYNPKTFQKSFDLFVEKTKKGIMYGEWNDYGRLLHY